jgi:glycosyltransferase involved in cell wall biosynthesis
MTEQWWATTEPLVLHVIPTPAARGAQREARALADQLDAPGRRAHRVLSLFDGPGQVRADFSLGFDGGSAPAVGYDPRLLPILRTALRRLDPAVVVAHGSDPLKYLVPAMLGRRRPLAYYAIGTYSGLKERRLHLWLWKRILKRVDVVAAEGLEVEEECRTLLGVPADRVVVIPNGRDPSRFHPSEQARPPGDPVLTFIGALTPGKRPDRFIEVVAELRRQGLHFRAQLIGDGLLGPSLRAGAAESGVELLGSRPDIAELLRSTDVMVFPSRPAGEGMPGVLIEAGLSGVPVVATDVPGVSTIVADGETGVIVAHDDLSAMVSATSSLLEGVDRGRAMGKAARQRCSDLFSLDAVARRWLEVLGPLLPADRPGRRPDPAGPASGPVAAGARRMDLDVGDDAGRSSRPWPG